jgi:hypothetical protein
LALLFVALTVGIKDADSMVKPGAAERNNYLHVRHLISDKYSTKQYLKKNPTMNQP